jgi:hypothetical protein
MAGWREFRGVKARHGRIECVWCGVWFDWWVGGSGAERKYCDDCGGPRGWRQEAIKLARRWERVGARKVGAQGEAAQCPWCDAVFVRSPGGEGRGRPKIYCTVRCGAEARRAGWKNGVKPG